MMFLRGGTSGKGGLRNGQKVRFEKQGLKHSVQGRFREERDFAYRSTCCSWVWSD